MTKTDHHAMRWIFNCSDPLAELTLLRLRFVEFYFEINYSAGVKQQAADALSRLSTNRTGVKDIHDEIVL